jgi:hypothetical protein
MEHMSDGGSLSSDEKMSQKTQAENLDDAIRHRQDMANLAEQLRQVHAAQTNTHQMIADSFNRLHDDRGMSTPQNIQQNLLQQHLHLHFPNTQNTPNDNDDVMLSHEVQFPPDAGPIVAGGGFDAGNVSYAPNIQDITGQLELPTPSPLEIGPSTTEIPRLTGQVRPRIEYDGGTETLSQSTDIVMRAATMSPETTLLAMGAAGPNPLMLPAPEQPMYELHPNFFLPPPSTEPTKMLRKPSRPRKSKESHVDKTTRLDPSADQLSLPWPASSQPPLPIGWYDNNG